MVLKTRRSPGGWELETPGQPRRGWKGAGEGGDRSGAGLQGGVWSLERGGTWSLGERPRRRGRGEAGGGEGRFEGAGSMRRVPEDPESVADRCLWAAKVPEREGEWQRGGPRGRKEGEAGAPGRASRGSPPPSRGLQTRPLRVRPLVGRSVGRWVSGLQHGSQLSWSEVGGTRERPAHLSRLERSPAPRSVGSPHALRPAARSEWEPPQGHCLGDRAPRS